MRSGEIPCHNPCQHSRCDRKSKCVLNASAEFGYDCPCDTEAGFILSPGAKKSEANSAGYGNNDRCIVDPSTVVKPTTTTTTTKATTQKTTTTTRPTTTTIELDPEGNAIFDAVPNVNAEYRNNPVVFGLGWASAPPKPDTQLYSIEPTDDPKVYRIRFAPQQI